MAQPNAGIDKEKYFKKSQLIEDYDLVFQSLVNYHPAPFLYTPEQVLQANFAAVSQNFPDSLSERDFIVAVMQLVAQIKCGHTSMNLPTNYIATIKGKELFLPFDVKISQNKMIVSSTIDTLSQLEKGFEILEINGWSAAQMVARLRSLQSRDGYTLTYVDELIYRRFRYYFFLAYGAPDSLNILYQKPDGQQERVQFSVTNKALPETALVEKEELRHVPLQTEWSTLSIDTLSQIAVLKIKSFGAKKGYKKYYKSVFAYLAAHPNLELYVDLRNNTGGYFLHGNHFLTYFHQQSFDFKFRRPKGKVKKNKFTKFDLPTKLTIFSFGLKPSKEKSEDYRNYHFTFKPQKNRFSGKLGVITNGITFSQAAIVAAELEQLGAITYGEEAGGGARHANAMAIANLTLPNSQLVVRIPYFEVITNNQLTPIGRGVTPKSPEVKFEP